MLNYKYAISHHLFPNMNMPQHSVSEKKIDLPLLCNILAGDCKLSLGKSVVKKITVCRDFLEQKIATSKNPIYGVNTGFGSLHNNRILRGEMEKLQKNLVMSHATGMGDEVPPEIVRLMLFLKIQNLSYGYSGVQISTVKRLIDFYNNDMLPVIYQHGSLGASGDLAPLAHLSLPLLGLGEVYHKGKKQNTASVYDKLNWKPLRLLAKEGLALLNGTQFMSAYGVWCLLQAKRLSELADMIASISIDAFDCRTEPYLPQTHRLRPHNGQIAVAANIMRLLKSSRIARQNKAQTQDPYSFRCIPQVHGASRDAIEYVENIFLTEVNSVTDNPILFPEEDLIISAGNFHGQPLALALDHLCIAVAELGSISERRTYKLLSGQRGLPSYLIKNPGVNSGLMVTQYTAASIVSENKQLCTPASVDTIDSSQGQEDHVSMGANAATKAYRVICNTEKILTLELLNAAQALEFRKPLRSSPFVEKLISAYRKTVPFIEHDKVLYEEINKTVCFLKNLKIR